MEQTGKIKVATWTGSKWTKIGTFLDIRDQVRYDGAERGLLGLAFAPDYATSHRFYVNYTRKPDGATVVAEFRRSSSARVQGVARAPTARSSGSRSPTPTTTAA